MSNTEDSNFKTYSEILKNNGIDAAVKEVHVKTPELVGDQYASQCKLVTVTFVNDSIPPLELFVKLTVTNPEYAAQIKECFMFEKEVRFFNLLLPDVKKFVESQPGYDGYLDRILPRCYFASDTLIVLENLMFKGYSLLDKKIPHDLDVTKQVIHNLAQFHGALLAYTQHIGEDVFLQKYDFLTAANIWSVPATQFNSHWIDVPIDGAIKILKEKPTPGSDKALQHFLQFNSLKFENTGFKHVCDLYKRDNQRCPSVVVHGDLWNGNVMFQRNAATQSPENCLLIDMQTVIFGTPTLDLQHYIFVATAPETIHSSWRKLIKLYYQDITEVMNNLGQEITFTYEDLEKDFQDKSQGGFFMSLYNAYGYDCTDAVGDMGSTEGDAKAHFVHQMNTALASLMETKGIEYSKKIVEIYQVFEDVKAGIERDD